MKPARAASPWLRWAFWLAIVALLVWMKGDHDLDCDEGVVLEGAWSLINGEQLYTESFQYIPPGSFYIVYWLWSLAGVSYFSAKALGILAIWLTAAAIFRTSRLVAAESPLTFVAPLLYCLSSVFWPAINHNTFSACLLAWATHFCARGVARSSTRDVLAGGLLTGLSGLFLLHKALAFGLAVAVFHLLVWRRRDLPTKSLPLYLLAAAAPLAALALKWSPGLLLDDLVLFPAANYLEANAISPIPLILTGSYVVLVFLALRGHLTSTTILLLIVQVALLGTALQRTDWSHTLILMFPTLALAPAASEALRRRGASRVRHVYAGAAVLASAFLLTVCIVATPWLRPVRDMTTGMAPLLKFVDDHCASLYAGPWLPGLYFEARKNKPISYPWLITGINPPGQFLQARDQLEAAKPQCAVVEYEVVKKFGYDQNNPVDRFIRANYDVSFRFWNMTVYTRRTR